MFSKFGFMLKTNLFYLAKASNPGEVKHPLCTNHTPAMYQPCPNLDKNSVKLSDPAPLLRKLYKPLNAPLKFCTLECAICLGMMMQLLHRYFFKEFKRSYLFQKY